MPELLEYGRPTVRDQREIVLGTILGTGAGIVLTIVVVGGVVLRDSPQSDLVASFLLPYAMLAAPAVTKAPWIYWPVIGFALAQYPVYGGYCGAGPARADSGGGLALSREFTGSRRRPRYSRTFS
jgi:hypothetical protein